MTVLFMLNLSIVIKNVCSIQIIPYVMNNTKVVKIMIKTKQIIVVILFIILMEKYVF